MIGGCVHGILGHAFGSACGLAIGLNRKMHDPHSEYLLELRDCNNNTSSIYKNKKVQTRVGWGLRERK
jgi:hypothetical protein